MEPLDRTTAASIVRFGRRRPWRGIIVCLAMGIGGTCIGTLFALRGSHFELAPLTLLFLLIPAIVIPLLIGLNQYAEFDSHSGFISINGGAPQPISALVWARTETHRVSTLYLGVGPSRAERFFVANGLFGGSRAERDWVRYLLQFTGLPRRGSPPRDAFSTRNVRSATLEDATVFAYEWLK